MHDFHYSRNSYLSQISGALNHCSVNCIDISFNEDAFKLQHNPNSSEIMSAAFYSVFKVSLIESALSIFNKSSDSLQHFCRQFCLDVFLLCPRLLIVNLSYCFSTAHSALELCAELSRACKNRIECGLGPIKILYMFGLTDAISAREDFISCIRDLQQYISSINF